MTTNTKRARWADDALTRFQVETRCDREDALTDLLCDLMHLADRERWDFNTALIRAKDHHWAELAEEASFAELPRPRLTLVPQRKPQ